MPQTQPLSRFVGKAVESWFFVQAISTTATIPGTSNSAGEECPATADIASGAKPMLAKTAAAQVTQMQRA